MRDLKKKKKKKKKKKEKKNFEEENSLSKPDMYSTSESLDIKILEVEGVLYKS